VRVCSEVRGAAAISVVYRGPQAVVGTSLDQPLIDSGCQFCGACVDVCPTGSLTERGLKGEGLPEESRETICPLCSLGCALEVDLKKGRIVSSRPKEDAPVNGGQACVKGRFVVRDTVHAPSRILRPMVRRDGKLVESSWDEALDTVARRLKEGKDRESAMIVSSQLALEDQYIAQKFAQKVLRTDPWVDFPGFSCPSLFRAELQKQKISLPLNFEASSLASAGIIMVAGADLVLSHPILWLEVLKAVRRGARLLFWNAAETFRERRATVSLRTKPGTELAALIYLCRELFEQRPMDRWSAIPAGEELKASLEKVGQENLTSSVELEKEEFLSAVRLLQEAGPAVFLIGPGVVQGPDVPRLVQMLWNLALLCEARIIPLAAENNERGVIEIWPSGSSDGAFEERVIDGLKKGRYRTLYLAGNLPDLGQVKTPDFLIVQGSYHGAAGESADVLLPAVTWAESDGTFINAEGRIQRFRSLIDPLGESRQDWRIFCRLAEKMGCGDFSFQSAAEITEEMSRAIPSLHEVSAHHLKKGRPGFVREDLQPSAWFIPLASRAGGSEKYDVTPVSAQRENVPDYYRGLDLLQESKGLKKLRERDKAPGQKREKQEK
jgi:predicted molibdopterin-dependent oxidoreductase YjgC